MKEETKAGLIVLSISVAIGLIVYFLYQKSAKIDDPVITIAKLDGSIFDGGNGNEFGVYRYFVNGKEHTLEGYLNATLVYGDKFKLKYSQKDPSKSKLISFAPVFTDDEVVLETVATIKKTGTFLGHYVFFEFAVDGIKYLRAQDINPRLSLEDIDRGSQFVVRYWRDNPQRAIIDLNQPIK